MNGLIMNELLKLSRKSKFYIIIIFLAVVTATQCYLQYTKIIAKAPEKIIEECRRLIEGMENMTVVQAGKDGDGNPDDVNKWIDETIEDAKKEIEQAQKELENKDRDWRINLKEKIKSLEAKKKKIIAEGSINKLEDINTAINIYNYYLEHDMEPDEEYIMYNTVILDIINYIGSIFLAIVVMLMTVETIAAENSPGTIKLLLTKPVTRGRIYISKFMTSLISSLGTVIAIETLTYLVIGIIFGFGNLQAPAAIGPKYEPDPVRIARYGMGVKPIPGSTVLVPIWQKLLIMLLLQALFIVVVVSFGMFISVIMKNGVSAIIFGLLITVILTVMTVQLREIGSIKALSTLMPFLFSTYSAGGLILTGYLSDSLSSTVINVPFAVIVMIAWSVLFFMSGYRLFVKKDVLA